MQSRWRSKAAWISTISLILFILKTYANIDIPQIDTLVNSILTVATAWGIFNNPTDAEKY